MDLPGISKADLHAWLLENIKLNSSGLSAGNQGRIFLCQEGNVPLVIKTPLGSGILKPLYLWMLRHEYRIYRCLLEVEGIPKCYGLLENRYLVLEYIKAKTLREHAPDSDDNFYQDLFILIQKIHACGVAHMDLKRKDNILITEEGKPYLIDFGVASKCRSKRAFLSRYLFHIGKHFDLNAWVKHKYRRQYNQVSVEDQQYLRRTSIERVSKFLKKYYTKIFGGSD